MDIIKQQIHDRIDEINDDEMLTLILRFINNLLCENGHSD